VYPADLLGPVRTWAKSHPIHVVDDHGSVVEFFRQQGIAVAAEPGLRGITVYAGQRALNRQSLIPLKHGETAVLFSERDTEAPHLVVDRSGRGTIVRVEMRLVDHLATDPLAHKILLDVFRHLTTGNEETSLPQGAVR
jgi:hypothetical protein